MENVKLLRINLCQSLDRLQMWNSTVSSSIGVKYIRILAMTSSLTSSVVSSNSISFGV